MKRIHLFEFEDQRWFPPWLRRCLTRLINVMHRLVKTEDQLSEVLGKLLDDTGENRIVDLCAGSGGAMPGVYYRLRENHEDLELTLTDLYPDTSFSMPDISYWPDPVDATNPPEGLTGIRTMVGSFHHMKPEQALEILKSAVKDSEAICIFEISDNSFPKWLWWIAIPVNLLTCLFVTPLVRPMTWQQLVFTYLIPIIPVCFAWDGAVSNARTYTLEDLDILINKLPETLYVWRKGTLPGKAKKLYLTGHPVQSDF